MRIKHLIYNYCRKSSCFIYIMFLLSTLDVYSQTYSIDTLSKWVGNGKYQKLGFEDLLRIQVENGHQNSNIISAYAEELLKRKEIFSSDLNKAKAYAEIGLNYSNSGRIEEAEKMLNESALLFERLGETKKLSDVYNKLGVHFTNTDADSTAVIFFTKAIQVGQNIRDTVLMIRPLRGLSGLFLKMGLFDKTIEYAGSGLIMAKKINDKLSIAALSNNVGSGHAKKGSYALAIKYFKEALVINRDLKLTESVIRNLSNIGTIYIWDKKLDSSSFYFEKAVPLLKEIDVPRTSIYTLSALGELRNKQGNNKEAILYATEVLNIASKAKLESLADGAYEVLVNAYKGMGDYDNALMAYEKYWEIKQRFLETNRNKTVSQIEQQFQQYKKEKEIEIKVAEIALLRKEQSLTTLTRNGAFVLVLLLIVLALIYFNRFKLKKRSADELESKNEEINQQHKIIQTSLSEKETLLREIHHRVKNNLQIISSLLNIQSSHIKDENVLASIHEGQSRVQAMSLIHQNLYQSDHLNNVDIENYLGQLVAYISSMYASPDKSISAEITANGLHFDIDTAIPLGLIVNELVSNSYKYAFKDQMYGVIKVIVEQQSEMDFELRVADNGIGIGENIISKDSNSLGLKLVKILSRQLRGSFSSKNQNGSVFIVNFKDLRAYHQNQK